MDEQLVSTLDTCLAQMTAGESLAACLDRYPAERAVLEPLLRASLRFQALPQPALPGAARATIEQRMLAAAAQRRAAPPPAAPLAPQIIVGMGAAVLLVLVVLAVLAQRITVPPQPRPLPTAVPALSSTALPTATPTAMPTVALTAGVTVTPLVTATLLPATLPPDTTSSAVPTLVPASSAVPAPTAPAGTINGTSSGKPADPHQCQGYQRGRDQKTCDPRPPKPRKSTGGKDDKKPKK